MLDEIEDCQEGTNQAIVALHGDLLTLLSVLDLEPPEAMEEDTSTTSTRLRRIAARQDALTARVREAQSLVRAIHQEISPANPSMVARAS